MVTITLVFDGQGFGEMADTRGGSYMNRNEAEPALSTRTRSCTFSNPGPGGALHVKADRVSRAEKLTLSQDWLPMVTFMAEPGKKF